MASLTWGDIALIGLVAFVGFSLLCYWVSAWMANHNVSGQLKSKPPKPKEAEGAKPLPPAVRKA